jgi:uncharacterized protein YqjF (DUF2071 family)
MAWHDLLFAHWALPAATLRPLVPKELEIDTFEGVAWLGVLPFRMTRVGAFPVPPVPAVASFPETNVRTYVKRGDTSGIWFLSLDAANPLAVRAARRLFGLPYYDARMSCRREGDVVLYRSTRTHAGAPPARLTAAYGPKGEDYAARPGDLDHWLTERYRFFTVAPDGAVRSVLVRHRPWTLAPATARFAENTMATPFGIDLQRPPDDLRFSRRLDVVALHPVAA